MRSRRRHQPFDIQEIGCASLANPWPGGANTDRGVLLKDTDPSGQATVLAYDPTTGLLATIADPSGRGKLTLAHDAKGLLTSVSDWL